MAAGPVGWSDAITTMRASGKRLAKMITPDGRVLDYDGSYYYDGQTVPVAGLHDVRALLEEQMEQADTCILRGELIAGAAAKRIRRLVFADQGNGDLPTLRNVPRRWLAVDHDGVPLPEGVDHRDLLACADAVLAGMPEVFARTECLVMATGSHGIKPGIRLRTFWWCDRPMAGLELKAWLRGKCDTSIFSTCQPIYVASPVFAAGRVEHLPYRLIEYPGLAWLKCPSEAELAPPAIEHRAPPEPTDTHAEPYALEALRSAARRICAAGDGNRHPTCRSEAQSLARLVNAGLLEASEVMAVLTVAFRQATGRPGSEAESIVRWALNNPSGTALPGKAA